LDEDPESVREFTDGITYPVLIDREHELAETYAITNVPTVIWIDEGDTIVRPNGVAFGNDLFIDFHGIESEPGKEAIRQWVLAGEVDVTEAEARAATADLSHDEVAARLHFRIGAHLRRQGDDEASKHHLLRAGELAPNDFTIRRAAMPLLGDDPFGEKFFELYAEWEAAGAQYNGITPERTEH
jgi:hypothetical protein